MAHSSDSIKNESLVKYLSTNLFAIPDYQRSYSWKTPTPEKADSVKNRYQVKEFWEDIVNGWKNDDQKHYYIGTIVLSDHEDKSISQNGQEEERLNVVDGQQRLVTLYLLYMAICDWYRSEKANHLLQEALSNIFYTKKGRNIIRVPRLMLPGEDGDNLDYLLKIIESDESACSDEIDVDSNIFRAYNFFKDKLDSLSQDYSYDVSCEETTDPIDIIGSLDTYLEEKLYVAVVRTEDEMRAHVVFESLNDRGIPLGAEDLIKNYLFSRSGKYYKEVLGKWTNILKVLAGIEEDSDGADLYETSKFDKFMQRYLNSFEPPLKNAKYKSKTMVIESTIFVQFKEWAQNKIDKGGSEENIIRNIVEELEHAVSMYSSLHKNSDYWKTLFQRNEPVDQYAPIIKPLEYINGMNSKNWYAAFYPLMFSILYITEKRINANQRKYQYYINNLKDCLSYLESYLVRSYVMDKSIRNDKFVYLARNIRSGNFENLVDIFNESIFYTCFKVDLSNDTKNDADKVFKEAMEVFSITKTGSSDPHTQFAKYLLRKIEDSRLSESKSEYKVKEYGRAVSLEHIFPKKFATLKQVKGGSLGWFEFYDEKERRYMCDYIFRLGNYTLIHGETNSEMDTMEWGDKRELLKTSNIGHTSWIAKNFDDWTPSTIDEAQKILAKQAVDIWSSPRKC